MNAVWSLKTTLRSLARGWNEFFHAPCDGRICAAVRMAYAVLVLIHLAVLYPDLDQWFTDAGFLPTDAARQTASPFAWSLFWLLPSTTAVVHTCFWITMAHAVMLLAGFWPRINAAALFVWLVSFQVRNTMIDDGEDTAMRMIGFFLIWMPLGRCWSLQTLLTSWWRRRSSARRADQSLPHTHPSLLPEGEGAGADERGGGADPCAAPGWGLRLLQIQMAVIYLSAGLAKLGGDTWVNGTAVYYVARLDDFFGRFPVPAWAFDTPWIVALLTWFVVVVELSVPILIWFRETRRLCLVGALLFHLGNEWTMHLFLFHWIMLCGWMSFLTPDDFQWLTPRRRIPEPRP